MILKHIAEKMSIPGNSRKSYQGVFAGVIFGQFDRSENIIDRKLNIHHRKRGDTANQLRRPASGDDYIQIMLRIT